MKLVHCRALLPVAFAVATLMLGTGAASAQTPENAPAAVSAAAARLVWHAPRVQGTPTARHENGFVALDGRLYLLGGRGERPLDIFDPATGHWTQGAQPPLEIHHMQAVTHEGKLYVLGALTGNFPEETPLSHVLIYDPVADGWTQGAEIPASRRRGGSGVVAHGGLIYMVGGNTRGHMSGFVPWMDVFDPETGRWTALTDAPRPRDHFHAVVIDGEIYAAGGRRSAHDQGHAMTFVIPEVDVYDIIAGQWRTLSADLPTPRAGTAATSLDGQLLVIGGESLRQQDAHQEVEAFDPFTGRWSTWPPLPIGRHGTQASFHDGLLYLSAGSAQRGGGPELNDLILLSPHAPR